MQSNQSAWLKYKPLILLLSACLLLFLFGLLIPWISMDKSNEFGDTAGAVNGLFSALAFAGVIYAIFMQRDELEMQRKELTAQKEEFQTQNATLKRQRFENTFFNMLQLHQQITDNISYDYYVNVRNEDFGAKPTARRYKEVKIENRGRDVFRITFEEAPHEGSDEKTYYGMRGLLSKDGMDGYENSYTPTYFDHYFRLLYRIFKFVAKSPLIEDEERYDYAAIVRSQLSRYELIWLYYNGLSNYGRQKFKPLIQTYSLLKNLRQELLVDGVKIEDDYYSNAFQPNS